MPYIFTFFLLTLLSLNPLYASDDEDSSSETPLKPAVVSVESVKPLERSCMEWIRGMLAGVVTYVRPNYFVDPELRVWRNKMTEKQCCIGLEPCEETAACVSETISFMETQISADNWPIFMVIMRHKFSLHRAWWDEFAIFTLPRYWTKFVETMNWYTANMDERWIANCLDNQGDYAYQGPNIGTIYRLLSKEKQEREDILGACRQRADYHLRHAKDTHHALAVEFALTQDWREISALAQQIYDRSNASLDKYPPLSFLELFVALKNSSTEARQLSLKMLLKRIDERTVYPVDIVSYLDYFLQIPILTELQMHREKSINQCFDTFIEVEGNAPLSFSLFKLLMKKPQSARKHIIELQRLMIDQIVNEGQFSRIYFDNAWPLLFDMCTCDGFLPLNTCRAVTYVETLQKIFNYPKELLGYLLDQARDLPTETLKLKAIGKACDMLLPNLHYFQAPQPIASARTETAAPGPYQAQVMDTFHVLSIVDTPIVTDIAERTVRLGEMFYKALKTKPNKMKEFSQCDPLPTNAIGVVDWLPNHWGPSNFNLKKVIKTIKRIKHVNSTFYAISKLKAHHDLKNLGLLLLAVDQLEIHNKQEIIDALCAEGIESSDLLPVLNQIITLPFEWQLLTLKSAWESHRRCKYSSMFYCGSLESKFTEAVKWLKL